jgi:hypothetical protein
MKCWHCKGEHDTVSQVRSCAGKKGGNTPTGATDTYEFLSMGQQKYLGDLLRQLHLELAGGATLETVSYEAGSIILKSLIDVRRSKAVGKPWTLPDGVIPLANPPSARATRRPTQKPMPDVPEGYYAIPTLLEDDGVNDLFFFRVKRPTEGNWSGRVFVDQVIGGKPEHGLREGLRSRQVLQAILDFGPEDAGILFAATLKHCRKCNIHLTRKASRVLMYGPECAEQIGLGEKWRELDIGFGHANAEDDE